MFDLNSLTEKEKSELETYILLNKCDLSKMRKIKNQCIIEKYENEFGAIPKEYRELFLVCIGKHFTNSGHKIQDFHIPYHYNEYHPLCFKEILIGNEVCKFNDIHSYYSCFTPTMTQDEIKERNNKIFQAQRSNNFFKSLSKGIDFKIESYLIGMYDILLASLENGRKITGIEAMNILKNSYQEAIRNESDILKPYMKSKGKK